MNVFLLFLLFSFSGGLLWATRKPSWRVLVLVIATLFICIAYRFLDQI